MCACGRSPREDGKCVGFHKLSEPEWEQKKAILLELVRSVRRNGWETLR
jgi:hypothetical protein